MKTWIERALAGLRWVGKAIYAVYEGSGLKRLWLKMESLHYDPPPLSYKRMLYGALIVLGALWASYHLGKAAGRGAGMSVSSLMTEIGASIPSSFLGDDLDVVLPEMEPLPPVPTPAEAIETLPSVEAVCHDMSDTPHCEPVYESPEKHSMGTQTEAQANPAEKAIAYKPQKKAKAYKKRRRPAAVLTPARDDFRLVL